MELEWAELDAISCQAPVIRVSLSWDGKHFVLILIHCNFCYFNCNLLFPKEALGERGGQIGFAPLLRLHPALGVHMG